MANTDLIKDKSHYRLIRKNYVHKLRQQIYNLPIIIFEELFFIYFINKQVENFSFLNIFIIYFKRFICFNNISNIQK